MHCMRGRWSDNGGMVHRKTLFPILLLIVGVAIGYMFRGGEPPPVSPVSIESAHTSEESPATVWTCSMHPQIRQPKPGQCPICGMDLIPVEQSSTSEGMGPRVFETSEEAKALMDIQSSLVERRSVSVEVRMVGKVDYDETRLAYISAWVPGRLDRLYVDYTGVQVAKGDHLVYLYSPEVLTTQEELRRAARAVSELKSSSVDIAQKTAASTLEAAREKLRRWGLTDKQIEEAERSGSASDHITIYAPIGGTVIERNGQEGMYVETGMPIYTIADLSQVWLKLDAYESDLNWLRYGQRVKFSTEAYPGETFNGAITFISPMLDEMTRTVKVRVNVPNPDGRLKPGMFARALVRASITDGGRVAAGAALAGKWMCPMHPEIIKDNAGSCDICGMALVQAESLGYVAENGPAKLPLVIPASAALVTGKRAVVYVEMPDMEKPMFEGREVVLGPRAGDYYVVEEGLREGERVVTNGNFKIDSALQILAKPSMMAPEGGAGATGHQHGEAHKHE